MTDQDSPVVSLRMMEGWQKSGNFEYEYLVLEHLIQECSFPPFAEFDTHVVTIRVTAAQDSTRARKVAKRVIQALKKGANKIQTSAHRRGAYYYVMATFQCSTE